MKRFAFAAAAGILSASARAGIGDQLPPQAYVNAVDRQIAEGKIVVPGRPSPCTREEMHGSIKVLVGEPTEECVKMSAPQRFRGLWRNDFEGSQFCPEPATTCKFDAPGDRIWLNEKPNAHADRKLYRVEFIGRKTLYKGPYGHMGVSDHEIIVDRMISKEVLWAPPSPTKAEVELMRRQCRAMPECSIEEFEKAAAKVK